MKTFYESCKRHCQTNSLFRSQLGDSKKSSPAKQWSRRCSCYQLHDDEHWRYSSYASTRKPYGLCSNTRPLLMEKNTSTSSDSRSELSPATYSSSRSGLTSNAAAIVLNYKAQLMNACKWCNYFTNKQFIAAAAACSMWNWAFGRHETTPTQEIKKDGHLCSHV